MNNEHGESTVRPEKLAEFKRLFSEFRENYLLTDQGRLHASKYGSGKTEALSNFRHIVEASRTGQDITDLVLVKLLAHSDTQSNRARGAWIHIAPAVTKDVKEWFEGAGWTNPADWPSVAKAILRLCTKCEESPNNLRSAALEFAELPYSKGFQTGMLSPILNALRPEDYLIINSKSRKVYKFLTQRDFSLAMKDYPASNDSLKTVINSLSAAMDVSETSGLSKYYTFDMFTHWFVAVRKYLKDELGSSFSDLFSDKEQGVWAFRLLADTLKQLGVKNPEDPRYSVTLRKHSDGYHLHLIFGNWLVLGFVGSHGYLSRLELAILADGIPLQLMKLGEFSQPEGEPEIQLCSVEFSSGFSFEGELKEHFDKTLDFVRLRFADWKASPFRKAKYESVALAIFDESKASSLLLDGFKPVDVGHDEEGTVRYWKIAPGDKASNWEACRKGNFIAIEWDELGDLSDVDKEGFEVAKARALKERPDWKEEGVEQVWQFRSIREGDKIIANRGTAEIVGVGTVTGPYYYASGERYGHRLPVRWDDTKVRQISEGGWRRTIVELDGGKFLKIVGELLPPEPPQSGIPFTEETFKLLEALHQSPNKEFYQKYREELKNRVEDPFQRVMERVVELLPAKILAEMETEKGVFAKIVKNDWGKGGAWDYYWGAFYPKGGKRIQDAQLFMWLNRDRLDFGFFIGEYGSVQKTKFLNALRKHENKLNEVLTDFLGETGLKFGRRKDFVNLAKERSPEDEEPRLDEWLHNPEELGIRVAKVLTRDAVVGLSLEDLAGSISELYKRIYPLVILTTSDDPLPAIGEYIKSLGPGRPPQEQYTIAQCSIETGMAEAMLSRWVKAVKRKGQAIIYGPPGTGKTFIAQKLAKLLTAGSDGFVEIVQFHSAYAYEDFVQGIRPKGTASGLDYPVVPGRFLEFCAKARSRRGECVLIIDEINRANLSRVLGELMYVLEYRGEQVPLAAGGMFTIPTNVRIIGTMNTADRSIALVDHALRRRFAFLPLYPDYDILQRYHKDTGFQVERLVGVLKKLNSQIADAHYEVGISFFLRKDLIVHLEDIWQMEIEPYIEEYFFDQREKVATFRWNKVRDEILG